MALMECVICGKPGGMTASKLSHGNGWLCGKCLKAAGGFSKWFTIRELPVEEIRALIEKGAAPADTIPVKKEQTVNAGLKTALTNMVSGDKSVAGYIQIDQSRRTVIFPKVSLKTGNIFANPSRQEYSFNDILGWELLENESSVTKGGMGSAAIGGALFGGAGAITGGVIGKKKTTGMCNSLRVKVVLRNIERPMILIDFLQFPTKTTSMLYNQAQEKAHKVMAMLHIIQDSCQQTPISQAASLADEIKKYKELLDVGAISEDEYTAKKKQLLGL